MPRVRKWSANYKMKWILLYFLSFSLRIRFTQTNGVYVVGGDVTISNVSVYRFQIYAQFVLIASRCDYYLVNVWTSHWNVDFFFVLNFIIQSSGDIHVVLSTWKTNNETKKKKHLNSFSAENDIFWAIKTTTSLAANGKERDSTREVVFV